MNGTRSFFLVGTAVAALAAFGAGKPVALVGDGGEALTIRADVTDAMPIKTVFQERQWIAPREWKKYAAVVLCDDLNKRIPGGKATLDDMGELSAVNAYLSEGGVVIFTGPAWAQLTATNHSEDVADTFAFSGVNGETFAKLSFGRGAAYCITNSIVGLKRLYQSTKTPLGVAGGAGEWELTEAGEHVAKLTAEYAKLFKSLKGVDTSVEKSDWGIVPLGPMAKGPPDYTIRNQPVFAKARPTYKPGLKVIGPGLKPVIVGEKRKNLGGHFTSSHDRAQELANYLKEMTGLESDVVILGEKYKPTELPSKDRVAVFVSDQFLAKDFFGVDFAQHPVGSSYLKRQGNWFLVGGDRSGASHALTYLLEWLGCRYLWPDKDGTGKIVPKRTEVVFPEIDWVWTPGIKHRGIRTYIPNPKQAENWWKDDAAKFGWTPADLLEHVKANRQDPVQPNRDFYAWHGVSDWDSLEGDYAWGHYYGDYWEKYHETHPEFFALQPNGSRDLGPRLGKKTNRPTLCLSCPGLAEETAKNLIERFRKMPTYKALSISLPDAGGTYACMCTNCRKLDPPNAKINSRRMGSLQFPYPAESDRMVYFANKVAEIVKKEFPDKRLCFYAYNAYTSAPYVFKPDPMFAVLCVSGEYSKGGQGLGTVCAWQNCGLKSVYWRPNLLWGMRTVAPQNFARKLFGEIEGGKANGMEGTDFDCYYDCWALQGFIYYMMSEALMNPDNLDYDTIANDYFASAFGSAAPAMKAYYDWLEKHFDTCAASGWTERHGFYGYSRTFDLAKAQSFFDEAKRLAKGDAAILARIAFFEKGLVPAKFEKAIVEAYDKRDKAEVKKRQDAFKAWIKENILSCGTALMPERFTSSYNSPCFDVRF